MCVCSVPGWPVLWLERWSHLWSPDWLAAAGEQAVGDRKPESFLTLWVHRPRAPDSDRKARHRNPHKTVSDWNHQIIAFALTCIMSGIACICIGVGESSPASWRFWRTRGLRRYSDCSSWNVHIGSGTSHPCTFIRCWERIRFTWNQEMTEGHLNKCGGWCHCCPNPVILLMWCCGSLYKPSLDEDASASSVSFSPSCHLADFGSFCSMKTSRWCHVPLCLLLFDLHKYKYTFDQYHFILNKISSQLHLPMCVNIPQSIGA